jgi:mRNA interferase MazF
LSRAERRPAVVIARSSREDWSLCQVTTNRYADSSAFELNAGDFVTGVLRHTSYARPSKLFTAEDSLITREVGTLRAHVFNRLIDTIIDLLNQGRK